MYRNLDDENDDTTTTTTNTTTATSNAARTGTGNNGNDKYNNTIGRLSLNTLIHCWKHTELQTPTTTTTT